MDQSNIRSIAVRNGVDDPSGTARRRTAVVAFHGIGQQVPFSTIDDVATLILRHADSQIDAEDDSTTNATRYQPGVRLISDGEKGYLARAELRLGDHDVHVYETYWAPIVAGKVTLRDVVRFLGEAFWNGIRYGLRPFQKWMFGEVRTIPFGRGRAIVQVLGAGIAVLVIFLLPFLLAYASGFLLDGSGTEWGIGTAIKVLTLNPSTWADIVSANSAGSRAAAFVLILLALLAIILLFLRRKAIDYFGDVVAYMSAHKVSPFQDLRNQIQEKSLSTLGRIYRMRDERGAWVYDDVIVLGHSLGSVIAYDALNALTRADNMQTDSDQRIDVARRTSLFLTFGSPLDRTAYFFQTQAPDKQFRNALATGVQPLLHRYVYRPRRWVNVYAKGDWISSPLSFYDPPSCSKLGTGQRVENVLDPESWSVNVIPLYSHSQYWNHSILGATIWETLSDPPEPEMRSVPAA